MALDKLVDGAQLDSDLGDIADAIRAKGGTSAELEFPQGFVDAVDAIETGIEPTGTKQISITQNGTTTEDVAAYANAEITVNVQGSGGDYVATDWLDFAKPSGDIVIPNATLTTGLSGRTGITSVIIQNATSVPANCFQGCTNLARVTAPKVTTIAANAFRKMKLVYAVFPALKNISGTYAFYENSNTLLAADFGGDGRTIANYTFRGQLKINKLILRGSTVWALASTDAFAQTVFTGRQYGGGAGYLYVPQALIEGYQAATNWSTILANAWVSILPIEGSIYETQYVDGTPIPTA